MSSSPSNLPPPPPNPLPLPPPSSRRLPPPCWSNDETVALISSYQEKWYSLRRGNLKAFHWQEVADGVALRCPPILGNNPKTAVQCRHKMEKLRKRYRGELQRAAVSGRRRPSSWIHFQNMDALEKGPGFVSVAVVPNTTTTTTAIFVGDLDVDGGEESDVDFSDKFYPKKFKMSNGAGVGSKMAIPMYEFDEFRTPSAYSSRHRRSLRDGLSFGTGKDLEDGFMGRYGIGKSGGTNEVMGRSKEEDVAGELVAAIKGLGEGFVRMERMKMEMAREVEAMRMDMEVKRTEMILESQRRIVESFAKVVAERESKRVKGMPPPEC